MQYLSELTHDAYLVQWSPEHSSRRPALLQVGLPIAFSMTPS